MLAESQHGGNMTAGQLLGSGIGRVY